MQEAFVFAKKGGEKAYERAGDHKPEHKAHARTPQAHGLSLLIEHHQARIAQARSLPTLTDKKRINHAIDTHTAQNG